MKGDIQLKPIHEQVCVVVGATSGIGRAVALQFAGRGAKVVVAARSLPELETLVEEIRGQGGEALAVAAEVSEFEQVKAVADQAVDVYGRIDTWVSSAAVMMYVPFAQTAPQEFKRLVDVNLLGQVYGAMAALPHHKREGRGALIHISSVEGRQAMPLQSAYAASKHALNNFISVLRMELEHAGIPVNVTNIMPASVNTPLYDKALTRIGVKPRPVPPVYEPEVIATAVLHAAEHPVRDMVVGGAGKAVALTKRLSPRLAELIIGLIAFIGQRSTQPKPDTAPHNLFQHLEGYDREKGSYSQEARSVSLYTWLQTHPAYRSGVAKWGVVVTLLAAVVLLSGRAMLARKVKRSPVQRWLRRIERQA